MNSKVYKWCAVPLCKNTSIKTPKKVFVHVPYIKKIRDKWLQLARRNPNDVKLNSPLYFCEDHFDLPNDMENYMEYHVMGSVSQVRMKPGCMPKKFTCQPGRKTQTSETTERPYVTKKRRMMVPEECEKQFEESIVTEPSTSKEIASCSSVQQTVEEVSQLPPGVKDRAILVHSEEPYTEPEVKIEHEEDHVTLEIQDPLDQSTLEGSHRELLETIADDHGADNLLTEIAEPQPKLSQEVQKKKKVVNQRKTPLVNCKKNLRHKMELKAKDEEISRLKNSLKTAREQLQQKQNSLEVYVNELKEARNTIRRNKKTIENQEKRIELLNEQLRESKRELNDLRKKFSPQTTNLDIETHETQESEMELAMQLTDMIKELATQAMNATKRATLSEQELAIQSIEQESDPLERRDFATQIANLMKDVTAFAVSTVNYTLGAFTETEIVREILVSLKQEFAKASSLMVQSDLVTQEERVVVKTEYTMDVEES